MLWLWYWKETCIDFFLIGWDIRVVCISFQINILNMISSQVAYYHCYYYCCCYCCCYYYYHIPIITKNRELIFVWSDEIFMLFVFFFNTSIEQIAHAERPTTTTTDDFQFPTKARRKKHNNNIKLKKKRDQMKTTQKTQSEFEQQTMRRGKISFCYWFGSRFIPQHCSGQRYVTWDIPIVIS